MIDDSISRNMIGVGEVRIIKSEENVVWTILGSCVSVIFHTTENLSLICHAQMPARGKYDSICADNCPHPCFNYLPESMDFKYVNCSIEYMIDIMKKHNINLSRISTALIGGASLLGKRDNVKTIGEQNVETARSILKSKRIMINRELVGGKDGYTIWFNSGTNQIFYKRHKVGKKIELI